MLRFTEVNVRGLEIDALTISWEIEPVDPVGFDSSLVEYRVYRSNSPEGPFDLLTGTPLVDTFVFVDRQINRRSFWRKHYYKVQATQTVTGKQIESIVHRAEVHKGARQRMLIGLEIARRERGLLQGFGETVGFVGVPCAVFIRRTFGQYCSECFDPLLGRGLSEKCVSCFNTRYKGGFFTPIQVHVNFSPSPQILQITNWGEAQPSETDCWLSNYPLMSAGDLVIEPTGRRWKVSRFHSTTMLLTPIRQILRLVEIRRTDVEYLIPVAESLFETPEFSELLSHNTEFEEIKS